MGKPILCLDFDGVIHSYSSGWKGADVIPDLPVEGAIAFMLEALNHFDVVIFSSRSNQRGGVAAMRETLGFGPDSIGKTLARVIRTGSDCPYPGIDAKAHGWWVGE